MRSSLRLKCCENFFIRIDPAGLRTRNQLGPQRSKFGDPVRGLQLAFLSFWLAFAFGILTLLPSEPGGALAMLFIWLWTLYCGVTMIRRSRADARRKLAEKQARAEKRTRHKP